MQNAQSVIFRISGSKFMEKIIVDKKGFVFTEEQLKDTEYTLKNAKDGDVISAHFWNKKEQHGGGFSFLYVDGEEFIGEKDRRKPEQSKTLLQLVSEGYHLHIRGHWGDGQIIPGTPSKCRTWWNDPDNFTLIDLMTLNKFLLTNQK